MSVPGARRIVGRVAPGYARPGDVDDPQRGLASSLLRYRVMATVVGVGLATLVFVGVPLQYGAGIPQVDQIVGPIHGFLYMIYLLAAVDLARRARFTLLQMAAMIGAGFIPLLAFVIERRVTRRLTSPPPVTAPSPTLPPPAGAQSQAAADQTGTHGDV